MGTALLLAVLLVSGAIAAEVADDMAAIRALQSRRQWAAAESVATAALHRVESARSPDSLAIADLLEEIVESRERRGGARDSLAPLQALTVLGIRLRRLPPDDPRIADAEAALSTALRSRSQSEAAFPHALRAYEIRRRRSAPDTLIAESLLLLGRLSRERADFPAAIDYLERAYQLRLRVHGENRHVMAQILYERAFALRTIGETDRARTALLEALRIDERIGGKDDVHRADVLDGLAALERQTGDLSEALALWQEALRVARVRYAEDDPFVVRIQRNRNGALVELGDYESSARLMEKIVAFYEKTLGPSHSRTLSARVSLGNALAGIGDSIGAMRELHAVETALVDKPGPVDLMLGLSLKFQVGLLQARGNDAAALALCRRAIALLQPNAAVQWENLTELHEAAVLSHVALGDTIGLERDRLALLQVAGARAVQRGIAPQVGRADALALRALGRDAEAWEAALTADRLARGRLQANVRSLPERRSLQLSLQLSPTTDLVLDLARRGADERRERAWDALVRVRGLVQSELARRRLPAEALADTALARTHARWRTAQQRYAQRLVAGAGNAEDAPRGAGPSLEALRSAAEDAERDRAAALAARGLAAPPAEVGWADVRARIAPGRALVGIVETEADTDTARVSAMVARGGSEAIEWVELGRSRDLRATIAAWRERLAHAPGRDPARAAAAERAARRAGAVVRARVWDRLAPHLAGATEVFVVEDGPLLDLPWQALPIGAHGYRVESGPRLDVLDAERALAAASPRTAAGALLAIGAPDYEHGATEAAADTTVAALVRSAPDPCVEGRLPAFGPLPASGAEAEAVAHAWRSAGHDATVLAGSEASEAAFKREARGHAVLHLATHGIVAGDVCVAGEAGARGVGGVEPVAAPARTARKTAEPRRHEAPTAAMGRRVWLALADANHAREHASDENEGLLTAEEVLTLDLAGTDWVVLSACHSGLAESWSREGVLGMRRAFRLAGARTVIASQWAVEDEATREWMEALYAARAHGAESGAAALESASRAVLATRRRAHRSTHPFYWAAFGATGE